MHRREPGGVVMSFGGFVPSTESLSPRAQRNMAHIAGERRDRHKRQATASEHNLRGTGKDTDHSAPPPG